MYNLKKLRPVHIDDLVRVGRNRDGGYILSSRQIGQTELLLSFGVCDDWSFEECFVKKHQNTLNNVKWGGVKILPLWHTTALFRL